MHYIHCIHPFLKLDLYIPLISAAGRESVLSNSGTAQCLIVEISLTGLHQIKHLHLHFKCDSFR